MAGVIETNDGAAPVPGEFVKRPRLDAIHIRIEAGQPKKPGRGAGAPGYRYPATHSPRSNIDRFQATIAHLKPLRGQRPDSEVHIILREALMRISESKATSNIMILVWFFEFEVPK